LINNTIINAVWNHVCLAKFDSNGYLSWYKIANGRNKILSQGNGGGGYGGGGGPVLSLGFLTNTLITTDNNNDVSLIGMFGDCNLLWGQDSVSRDSTNWKIYIAKFSSVGALLSLKKANPLAITSFQGQLNAICSRNNHIYLTGKHNNGQILIAEYDENGNNGAFSTFGTGSYAKEAVDICTAADNHFYVTGSVTTNTYLDNIPIGDLGNNSNMFFGKLHIFPTDVPSVASENSKVSLYPVPSTGLVNIAFERGAFSSVTICNITGQVMQSLAIGNSETLKTIDLTNLPSGVYTALLKGKQKQEMKKMVIAR